MSSADALTDIELLKNSLLEGHPSLYLYTAKQNFESDFCLLREKVKNGIDLREFYLMLVKTVSHIQDGHTRMMLPTDYRSFIFNESKSIIPLALKFIDNKIFIYQNYSTDNSITDGDEVISLNGIDSKTILARLRSLVTADANIKGFLNRRIELEYKELLSLLFNLPATYSLTIKKLNGISRAVTLRGSTMDSISLMAKNKYPQSIPPLKFEFFVSENKDHAILTIRDFLRGPDNAYFNFLDSVFTVLQQQQIPHLIIDLRQNVGGYDEHAIALLSYLVKNELKFYKETFINKTYFPFLKYTNSEQYNKMAASLKTIIRKDSTYSLTLPWENKYEKKKDKAYKGKIYFLINERVFSSAMALAANAYNYSDAVFIGVESGGAYIGSAGAPVLLTLPNSKFVVQIPLVYSYYAVHKPNKTKGLYPTYYVENSMADILANNDRQMQFALKLIHQKK